QRADEAPLQVGLIGRPRQRDAGEDLQAHAAIALGDAVERVDEAIGLTDADGYGQHDIAADAIDYRLGALHRIVGLDSLHGRRPPRAQGCRILAARFPDALPPAAR